MLIFSSVFRYFLFYISALLYFCLIILPTFSQISLDTSKSLLYIFIFGRNMYNGIIYLAFFVTNEIFKILFTERKLFRYYYFINICIAYRNRAFMLMKFVFFNLS